MKKHTVLRFLSLALAALMLLSLSLINLYKGLCIRVVRVSSDGEE